MNGFFAPPIASERDGSRGPADGISGDGVNTGEN